MKKCKFCSLEFKDDDWRKLGAHVTNCEHNPNRKKTIAKIKQAITKKQKKFQVNCFECGNPFQIQEFNTDKPKKEKYFCSRSCANKRGKRSDETKRKISESLKGRFTKPPKEFVCLECNKTFYSQKRRERKYCSSECQYKSTTWRKKVSEVTRGLNAGNKNGMYGISPPHANPIQITSHKTKSKSFFVRSSYEKEYVDILNGDDNIISFEYEPKEYKVKYLNENGMEATYQPDFLVNESLIVEIKNNWNVTLEEVQIKKKAFESQFPNIEYKIIHW